MQVKLFAHRAEFCYDLIYDCIKISKPLPVLGHTLSKTVNVACACFSCKDLFQRDQGH